VLYDPTFEPPVYAGVGDGMSWRPALYGAGALAVAGLAAGGGGGSDPPPSAVSAGPRSPDAELKVTSAAFVNTRIPVITGEGEPGARILVQLDGDGDGSPDVGYITTVAPDFTWRVDLGVDVPAQGSLP